MCGNLATRVFVRGLAAFVFFDGFEVGVDAFFEGSGEFFAVGGCAEFFGFGSVGHEAGFDEDRGDVRGFEDGEVGVAVCAA